MNKPSQMIVITAAMLMVGGTSLAEAKLYGCPPSFVSGNGVCGKDKIGYKVVCACDLTCFTDLGSQCLQTKESLGLWSRDGYVECPRVDLATYCTSQCQFNYPNASCE